jgi:hypothetical protein
MANFDKVADIVEEVRPLAPTSSSRWRRYATWDQGFELLCVVIMALASLAAAWSGYQASNWSGAATVDQTRGASLRLDANRAAMDADIQVVEDMSMFDYWTTAYITNDTAMADFYRARFSPELEAATTEWLATDPFSSAESAPSPFDLPGYAPPGLAQADTLTSQAEALFDAAVTKLDTSGRYVMSTVILATVVFFGGLAAKLSWIPARLTSIVLSVIMLGWGVLEIVIQPVQL